MTQMVQALRGETPLEARAVLPVLRPALLGFSLRLLSQTRNQEPIPWFGQT